LEKNKYSKMCIYAMFYFNYVADEQDRRFEMKKKISGAVIYPLTVLITVAIISLVILRFVIPVFEQMFSDFGGSLPVPTRVVVAASNFIKTHDLAVFLIAAALFVILFRFKKHLISLLSCLPLVGSLSRKISTLQFVSYLSIPNTAGCRRRGKDRRTGFCPFRGITILW
jgi:type IV pilus assembly protein PilC